MDRQAGAVYFLGAFAAETKHKTIIRKHVKIINKMITKEKEHVLRIKIFLAISIK